MGVAKNTRKFAQTKRVIGKRDARLKENKDKADIVQETKKKATANGELSMSRSHDAHKRLCCSIFPREVRILTVLIK